VSPVSPRRNFRPETVLGMSSKPHAESMRTRSDGCEKMSEEFQLFFGIVLCFATLWDREHQDEHPERLFDRVN
jgi:hypothetical protein